MKNIKNSIAGLAIAFTLGSFLSCQKENNEPVAIESEVTFAISSSILKNSSTYNLNNANKIVITIQLSDGSPTNYTSSEIKIQQMNGQFYSQKIVLKTGDYSLTEFLILDNTGNTIFAAPKAGSQEAQNVSKPIPIAFSVIKNSTTPVKVEVVSTENRKPEDFGLNQFPIVEVKTFDFMIGVTDKESGEILSAKLIVSSWNYSYIQNLGSTLNNVVKVKDGFANYTLKVEKNGYTTYQQSYTANSLKLHSNIAGNLPLLIELEKDQELTVTDIDGNVYKTIKIGTQIWMSENLKVTHYPDGRPVPYINNDDKWESLDDNNIDDAYCYYNNNPTSIYGALYSWAAAMGDNAKSSSSNPSSLQGICPAGWHLPSYSEWNELLNFVEANGYVNSEAKALKATSGWINNGNGTDAFGFSALPGGCRGRVIGSSVSAGEWGTWWSATEYDATTAYDINIINSYDYIFTGRTFKSFGYSVRCLKN